MHLLADQLDNTESCDLLTHCLGCWVMVVYLAVMQNFILWQDRYADTDTNFDMVSLLRDMR